MGHEWFNAWHVGLDGSTHVISYQVWGVLRTLPGTSHTLKEPNFIARSKGAQTLFDRRVKFTQKHK